jgi:uncharacterized protein YndB with AHSA1/START domain
MDVKPGGAWRYVARLPTGYEMTFRGVYREIVPHERLVSTECFVEPSIGNPEWLSTITFEEHDGITTMTNRVLHPTKEARDGHLNSGMEAGASETFDRLEELLASAIGRSADNTPGDDGMTRELEITRVFKAPRKLVYEAWTDPKHMTEWWGPGVFTNHSCVLDVRPGGAWQIIMRSPDGMDYPCRGVYREVVAHQRLVFTNNAYDAQDKQLLDGLTTVEFAEDPGGTRLTLNTKVTGLVDFAPMMLRGMEAGWNQSLDSLAKHLAG